jgi:hypothetical protein
VLLPCLGILFFKVLDLPFEGNATSILLLGTPMAALSFTMAEAMGATASWRRAPLTAVMLGFADIFWTLTSASHGEIVRISRGCLLISTGRYHCGKPPPGVFVDYGALLLPLRLVTYPS